MTDENSHTIPQSNRRTFTRIFFDAETVVTQGDHIWPVQLIDISLRGILIQVLPDQKVIDDNPVDISIHLGGDIQICMTARVANHKDDKVGLLCEHIDVDSMTHLRRLVELNMGDTSLLERELSALN
ncbi:PilZ domain-containing protein [Pseudohongiella sp.]|uniref:PilZ domain-containing protein n=1 Tax=marine sediment metagenome TaxID=412755 RepID=A0A0F9YJI7_9ZZZZ|nr:PilZ domain-containing protein [Pseudohongiella sp.]HDZ07573.1 PilZ domain-containing protein [Pseudohongiella sp.]HEA64361.1 PilZ domain-containing protein [Pseudohongiella sp.]